MLSLPELLQRRLPARSLQFNGRTMLLPVRLLLTILLFALGVPGTPSYADPRLRDQEINQCPEGELISWTDGRDRPSGSRSLTFIYIHAGAPLWFREQQVLDLLSGAALEWSKCGIPAQIHASAAQVAVKGGEILVQWNAEGSGGNFGLANLSKNQLSLGLPAFQLLNQQNPAHNSLDTLQMVLSHEMGHFYGLMAHSRRCVDVLSYYHDGKGGQCFTRYPELLKAFPEYRSSLPTACDIQRCRVVNQASR